jgi:hypothetical protein
MIRPASRALAAGTLGGVLLAAGCAPPPSPDLTAGARAELYAAALERRLEAARTLDLDVALWLRPASGRDLPGATAALALRAPAGFHLRVHQPFGTALEIGGADRKVAAFVPSKHLAFESEHLGDTLGVTEPAAFVVRVAAALWRPDGATWSDSALADHGRAVRWQSGAERVSMDVDSYGLPHVVDVESPRMGALHIEYTTWFKGLGTQWPGRIEVTSPQRGGRLLCRVDHVDHGAGPDSAALAVYIPPAAKRLDWSGVMRQVNGLESR